MNNNECYGAENGLVPQRCKIFINGNLDLSRIKGLQHYLANIFLKSTVYPKKYAHGFCFAVLCCGYTLTDFPISIRLTSLALWQSNDSPVTAKQPWWIWKNTSCEFIMNDCITTTKQSTTKPCAYFLGYTVIHPGDINYAVTLYEYQLTYSDYSHVDLMRRGLIQGSFVNLTESISIPCKIAPSVNYIYFRLIVRLVGNFSNNATPKAIIVNYGNEWAHYVSFVAAATIMKINEYNHKMHRMHFGIQQIGIAHVSMNMDLWHGYQMMKTVWRTKQTIIVLLFSLH